MGQLNLSMYFAGDGDITVYTIRPKNDNAVDHLIFRGKAKQILELGRWYNLSIEILDNNFTIFLDNRELIAFADRDTLPGTVSSKNWICTDTTER